MNIQYVFNLYNNDIDKIKPNKFIDLLINKTKNFVFANNFTNEYKIYKRQLQLNEHSISYQILKDIINIKNKNKFIEWYNLNSYEIYKYMHLILNHITKNNKFEKEFYELKKIYVNPFISFQINEYIQNKIQHKYHYENKNLNITIFSENNIDAILLDDIHNIINFINSIFNHNKEIILIIFLTPYKKEMSGNFSPHEINTGSTNRISIILWREEELIKVLIHELIHFLHLDLNDDSIISKKLKNKVNIDESSDIRPNEAYTELIAIILHSFYITLKQKSKFDIKYFNYIIEIETKWSIYQCAKIINNVGCFNKFEDLLNKDLNCKILQYTSIFSYFIIKTSMLYNLNNFFVFLQDINQSSFNFNDSIENYNKFYKFIIKCLSDTKFNNIINNIMEKTKNYIILSMKMSFFG